MKKIYGIRLRLLKRNASVAVPRVVATYNKFMNFVARMYQLRADLPTRR